MSKIITAAELVAKAQEIEKTDTVYMWGTYGRKVTEALIAAKAKQYPRQYSEHYQSMLRGKIGHYSWDCIGLIKGIIWGWDGKKNVPYAPKDSMPDIGSNGLMRAIGNLSTDWKKVKVGAAVFLPGHVGIYVGDGHVIEATPSFKNGVQITAVAELAPNSKYPKRKWTQGHGLIPWVDYKTAAKPIPAPDPKPEGDYYLHTVKKGDNPWNLAFHYLGDGRRFPEITDLNNLDYPYTIYTNTKLKIPGLEPIPQSYTVRSGDTLSSIASRYLGSAWKWKEIADLNKLPDPDKIYRGQVLKLPQGAGTVPRPTPEPPEQRVKVTASIGLNYRSGAGTAYRKLGALNAGQEVAITKVQAGWGYVPEVKGWISLNHVKRI